MGEASQKVADLAGRRRTKGARTAERILDAAEALFAERGYAGTTLRDVAGACGIRNPSLYNHFTSKESLYAAVLERGLRPMFETMAGSVEAGTVDQFWVAEHIMDLLVARPAIARLVQHETLAGGEHLTPMLHEWVGPMFARARELIEAQGGTSPWRPEDIPHLILAMYQVILGYFTLAPLYREMTGQDLFSERARAEQKRFLLKLITRLFPAATAR